MHAWLRRSLASLLNCKLVSIALLWTFTSGAILRSSIFCTVQIAESAKFKFVRQLLPSDAAHPFKPHLTMWKPEEMPWVKSTNVYASVFKHHCSAVESTKHVCYNVDVKCFLSEKQTFLFEAFEFHFFANQHRLAFLWTLKLCFPQLKSTNVHLRYLKNLPSLCDK